MANSTPLFPELNNQESMLDMEYKGEIIGGSVAAISSLFAVLSYLWDIGFLPSVFSFLSGAFITYVVQHRLQMESEKRKNEREHAILMRDKVYGLIFMEVTKLMENINDGVNEYALEERLDNIMLHYLYFTVKSSLRNQLTSLLERYSKYKTIRNSAEKTLERIVSKELKRLYRVDASHPTAAAYLRIYVGETFESAITIKETVFQKVIPKDFVEKEKQKWGKNVVVHVDISGAHGEVDLKDFEQLNESVLSEVEKKPVFADESEHRKRIIQEIETFLGMVKPFVDLK